MSTILVMHIVAYDPRAITVEQMSKELANVKAGLGTDTEIVISYGTEHLLSALAQAAGYSVQKTFQDYSRLADRAIEALMAFDDGKSKTIKVFIDSAIKLRTKYCYIVKVKTK